jgi:hypothetical protein
MGEIRWLLRDGEVGHQLRIGKDSLSITISF